MILLFANNAVSELAAPISAIATSVQVAAGQGALFPNPVVGQQYFLMTFVDALTGEKTEIVQVTARAGDYPTGRSSAITLPSFGKLPGATNSTAPRILVTACKVAATASPRLAPGDASWPKRTFAAVW